MPPRSRRSVSLEKLIATAATPVFALNDRQIVIAFNSGCEKIFGWPAAEVVGKACRYASEPDCTQVESVTSMLCPPPEVFHGAELSAPLFLVDPKGTGVWKSVHFIPIRDEENRVTAVLGWITELQTLPKVATPHWLHAELAAQKALVRSRFGIRSVVARSPQMIRALRQAQIAAAQGNPLLITGETGTGRQHLARVIHSESAFSTRCFVPLDCGRLPPAELKATLRRMFQMCDDQRTGDGSALEALLPGTVYLKSANRLPPDLQEWIAAEFRIEKASERRLRLIGASDVDQNWDPKSEQIRPSFYFLLSTQEIAIPPLRQRDEDIPLLATEFLETLNKCATAQRGGFHEETLQRLREYRWPGNVRELKTVIQEAFQAGNTPQISRLELPLRFLTGLDAQRLGPRQSPLIPLEQFLEQAERRQIERALEMAQGNKSLAADLLGIPRPRLYRRLDALGLATESPEEPTSMDD